VTFKDLRKRVISETAIRGLPNVSFILLDEADFFPPGQQQDARDVSERYIAKSNPYIQE
jgi:hypothetical protein